MIPKTHTACFAKDGFRHWGRSQKHPKNMSTVVCKAWVWALGKILKAPQKPEHPTLQRTGLGTRGDPKGTPKTHTQLCKARI